MALRIYNTLTRQEEDFVPLDPANVRLYVCGPTVYDFIHIGNGRPIVVFDVLFRLLQRLYPKVTYVRNITDVEDKIMDRALENGESIDALTARTTKAFHDDVERLGALPPTHEPRATQYIAQMLDMMRSLIDKKHAYVEQGHVLFSVPSMKDYGRLSRHSRDELVAGARVELAPYKRDAADFVLWKPSTPQQVGWDSPWGRGRPGWHIECSAMSGALLGDTFDIHGGGLDLIFPHHENEIAQSRCAHGTAVMAKYWMHNGFVQAGNDEKMSKSLGNFFTLHELFEEFPGEAVRYLLLSGHYRQPLDFTKDGLKRAKASLDRLYQALRLTSGTAKSRQVPAGVEQALLADLNTPLALSALHDAANRLNAATNDADKAKARSELLGGGALLGLLQQDPEGWFKGTAGDRAGLGDSEIDALIAQRLAARQGKNFAEADRIRKLLADSNIVLEDGAKGTSWRRG